jgi:hypothetical protein
VLRATILGNAFIWRLCLHIVPRRVILVIFVNMADGPETKMPVQNEPCTGMNPVQIVVSARHSEQSIST